MSQGLHQTAMIRVQVSQGLHQTGELGELKASSNCYDINFIKMPELVQMSMGLHQNTRMSTID